MDNVCHTLVGAACGEAGLGRRTRFGHVTLMIAANLPDLDVLVFATSASAIAFRRGWTHGVLAQVLLPVALTGVMVLLARLRPARAGEQGVRAGPLLALAYVGVFTHVGLDYLNTYGIRLLMPFDGRWFYGDAVFIIDPWLWLALGLGVCLARRRSSVRPARAALGVVTVYIGAMLALAHVSRAAVLESWEAARGEAPAAVMVGPRPARPFVREVIVDAGDRYETGTAWWPSGRVLFDPEVVLKNAMLAGVEDARTAAAVRGFLVWSRFPYWTREETADGLRITVRDVRFGSARGDLFSAGPD